MSREKKQSDWDELQELTQASMNPENETAESQDASESKRKPTKSTRAASRKKNEKPDKVAGSRKKTVKRAANYDPRDISLALGRTPNFESLNDEKMSSVVAAATLVSLEASANAQAEQAAEAEEKPKRRRRAPATEKDSVISGIMTQITQAPMRRKSRKAKEASETPEANANQEQVEQTSVPASDVAELHYEPTPFVELRAPAEEPTSDLLSAKLEQAANDAVDPAPVVAETAAQPADVQETPVDDFWGEFESLDVSWGRPLNTPTVEEEPVEQVQESEEASVEAQEEALAEQSDEVVEAVLETLEVEAPVEEVPEESVEPEASERSEWDDFWHIDDSLDIPWGRQPASAAKAVVEAEEVVVDEVAEVAEDAEESVVPECVEALDAAEEPVEEPAQEEPEDFWQLDDSLEISWGRQATPKADVQEKAPKQKRGAKKSRAEEPKQAALEKVADDVESFFGEPVDEGLGFTSFDDAVNEGKGASKKTKPEKKRRREREADVQVHEEFDSVDADVQPVKTEKAEVRERARKMAEEFAEASDAFEAQEKPSPRAERKRERKERRRDDAEPVDTTPNAPETQERPAKREASEIVLPSWEVAVSYVVRANIIRHNMSLEGKRK